VDDVRRGIGADRRIGYQFINPGVGYGGSCFPKDVKALISTARGVSHDPIMLDSIEAVNERQKRGLVEKITAYYGGDVRGRTFAVWGLSFKPETDDVREAPALVIIDALLKAGARVRAYDPKAMKEARRYLGERDGLIYTTGNYEAVEGSDALILVTEWSFFLNPDFLRIKKLLKAPVIFDGRNVYSPELMKTFGFDYFAVGRKPVLAYSSENRG
jgi:UDPglucose 6-dehydrogenase